MGDSSSGAARRVDIGSQHGRRSNGAPACPRSPKRSSSRSATTGRTRSPARCGSRTPRTARCRSPRTGRWCCAAAGARRPSPTATAPTPGPAARSASTPACRRPATGSRSSPARSSAAPFHFSGEPGEDDPPFYGRYANPTWSGWERALGELEGGEAVAFASGMAAIAAVLLTTLGPGDVLVLPSDGYYTVRTLAERHLEPRGRGGAPRADRRRRDARRARGRDAALARDAVEPRPGRRRRRGARRRRARRPGRSSRSTTRSPRRCASARWSSAPTSRWPAPRSS